MCITYELKHRSITTFRTDSSMRGYSLYYVLVSDSEMSTRQTVQVFRKGDHDLEVWYMINWKEQTTAALGI